MVAESKRLLIMACSQRKRSDPGLLPAIERYDGPQFQVLHKFARKHSDAMENISVYILSAHYGLIPGTKRIPNYDQRMTVKRAVKLALKTQKAIQKIFQSATYTSLFLGLGRNYFQAMQGYEKLLPPDLQITIATGSQGRRQGQLRDWLYQSIDEPFKNSHVAESSGTAIIREKRIELSQQEILDIARQSLPNCDNRHTNYQTWYVQVDEQKISPKWLVSKLTGLPVGAFHSGEARRVLQQLGVEVRRI
jgi:hypothetical protein